MCGVGCGLGWYCIVSAFGPAHVPITVGAKTVALWRRCFSWRLAVGFVTGPVFFNTHVDLFVFVREDFAGVLYVVVCNCFLYFF